MKFNITYDSNVNATTLGTNLALFKSEFAAAAAIYQNAFSDDITINLVVKYGPLAGGAAAQTSQFPVAPYAYSGDNGIQNILKKDGNYPGPLLK